MRSRAIGRVRFAIWEDQEGLGLAECALILALVAIVALLLLGRQISNKLSTAGNET